MPTPKNPFESSVLVINHEGMGQADAGLQTRLIATYLKLLIENEYLPNSVCFYTNGVKLVIEGSPVLEELAALEQKGVRLIVCSTCLGYLGLSDKVKVGIVGGMTDILSAQAMAEKVITL